MGLFDFFKKGKNKKNTTNKQSNKVGNDYFVEVVDTYRTYTTLYLQMQLQGNYSPIAAYELPDGTLQGFLYSQGNDTSYDLSATEVIERMTKRFEQQLREQTIRSYVLLYHSQLEHSNDHRPATTDKELRGLSIVYHFYGKEKGAQGMPYEFKGEQVEFGNFSALSATENDRVFNAPLEEGKDYFQDREEIVTPRHENEVGLVIRKSNLLTLHDTWGGIFGFESHNSPQGGENIQEYFSLAVNRGPTTQKGKVTLFDLDYKDVTFRVLAHKKELLSMLPIVKTDYVVPIKTRGIQEWENVESLEAIVEASGRDTFGVWFFATDYAENRATYRSQRELSVHLSGIAFVVHPYIEEEWENEERPKYSEDFTAYMPNNDLPNYACFDFIGELEDFRATTLLEDDSLKGYILTVRLITESSRKDFFTIDMYATPENMRVSELQKGMKLTGMFQLQGCIARR